MLRQSGYWSNCPARGGSGRPFASYVRVVESLDQPMCLRWAVSRGRDPQRDHSQAHDVRAVRRGGRRANYLAARDNGCGKELGLSILLDKRRRAHNAGLHRSWIPERSEILPRMAVARYQANLARTPSYVRRLWPYKSAGTRTRTSERILRLSPGPHWQRRVPPSAARCLWRYAVRGVGLC